MKYYPIILLLSLLILSAIVANQLLLLKLTFAFNCQKGFKMNRTKSMILKFVVAAVLSLIINSLFFARKFKAPTFNWESMLDYLSTNDPLPPFEQNDTNNNNRKENTNVPKHKFAIFFNTFSRSESTSLAKSIITSQLQEINAQPLLQESPIFYTRIGNYADWEWPLSLCQGMNHTSDRPPHSIVTHYGYNDKPRISSNSTSTDSSRDETPRLRVCTEIAAVPTGDEMITLSELYKYCHSPENHESTVVYMHSKGTYTSNAKNDGLRALLMKAVLSMECLLGTTNNNVTTTTTTIDSTNLTATTCDTCSTRFSFLPFSAYVGNMFVAKCNYISKLTPPHEFEEQKQKVINTMKNATTKITLPNKRNIYETKLDNQTSYKFREKEYMWIDRKSWIGVDRYAAEHWIASHPDIRPCEVFPQETNPAIIYGRSIPLDRFQKPKLTSIQDTMTTNVSKQFWSKNGKFYHPWYSDKGKLFEFQQLYGAVPKTHSWFYTFWSQY